MLVIDYTDPRRNIRKLPPETTLVDRVLLRVTEDEECWIFTGTIGGGGYGVVRRAGVNYYAHIVTWTAENGAVPKDLVLDHRVCRRRACCRPDHLEPVSNYVNVYERSFWKSNGLSRVTHCRRGHAWTPENEYQRPDGLGRQCRECIRIRSRR